MKRKSISQHPVTRKYMPQRTCVACRQVKTKRELIRLVRVSDGRVEVDVGEKKAGRGAYLCQAQQCWQIGLKGNRLAYALRTTLTQDNREELIRYGEGIGEGG